jgi:hypothetical protein
MYHKSMHRSKGVKFTLNSVWWCCALGARRLEVTLECSVRARRKPMSGCRRRQPIALWITNASLEVFLHHLARGQPPCGWLCPAGRPGVGAGPARRRAGAVDREELDIEGEGEEGSSGAGEGDESSPVPRAESSERLFRQSTTGSQSLKPHHCTAANHSLQGISHL